MLIVLIVVLLLILCDLYLLSLCAHPKERRFRNFEKFDYAHRGLHNRERHIPENSLTAFWLAAESGYGAELDVHLSKDGRLVVMHDESLLRMTGYDKNICDCTAQELESLRLEDTEELVPYLEEVLPLFEGKAPLIIELKTHNGNHVALCRKVCAMARQFRGVQFCIESFDPRALIWLRKHRPKILRGQLSCRFDRESSGLSGAAAFLLTNLMTNFLTQPHFIAYRYEDRNNLSLRLCKLLWQVQEVNWTIRNDRDAQKALDAGSMIIFEHCHEEGGQEEASCTTN